MQVTLKFDDKIIFKRPLRLAPALHAGPTCSCAFVFSGRRSRMMSIPSGAAARADVGGGARWGGACLA